MCVCCYFKFKSHLLSVVILRPMFLVQDKMFRKFLKKILKNLNSLKKSLKPFKIPIFKDNSLKVRALSVSLFCKVILKSISYPEPSYEIGD